MYTAKIYITLKEGVLDSQGNATLKSLHSLEFKNVKEVNFGKLIIVKLDAENEEKAKKEIEEMCEKLLYNPAIEKYTYEVFKEESI